MSKKKQNLGTFLYLPLFNPKKAVEITKKELYKSDAPPDRFVDVLLEVDKVRYEFTMDEFLTKLGILPGKQNDETSTP